MKVCGIVAEYNPLHNGHAYHIAQAREKTGCDYVVAAMSGSFVQRGEPAAFDKWERARWALHAGIDLVIELPAVSCLQSAEGFARGGIRLLASTGVVTHLCFGSECADLSALGKIASALDELDGAHTELLGAHLAQGKSFPRAQAEALAARLPQHAPLLSAPNFILGVEYLRALRAYAPDIVPVAIERTGSGYNDESLDSPLASAKAIRQALKVGLVVGSADRETLNCSVPPYVDLFASQPASLEKLESVLLYCLRSASADSLREICGVGEGFENALLYAAQQGNLACVLDRLKSKRYTLARIRRVLCCAMLDITRADLAAANEPDAPGYLRVLGFAKSAAPLLSALGRRASAPVVTQKAHMDALAPAAKRILDIDLRASDLQALAFDDARRRAARRDYTEPVVIEE